MTQLEAFTTLLLHFSYRVKSERRETLFAVKSINHRGLSMYAKREDYRVYYELRKRFPQEESFIEHLASFITDDLVKPGAIAHISEIVVTNEYPMDDQRLILHLGNCMGLSEDVINNIMHVVLSKEAICN